MSIRHRLIQLFWDYDTEPIEGLSGVTAVFLGGILLFPANSYSTGAVWRIFDGYVSEIFMGAFFLTVGSLKLIALTWGTTKWRKNAALLMFMVWVFFTIMFFGSSPPATNGAYTLSLSLFCGWTYLRLRGGTG